MSESVIFTKSKKGKKAYSLSEIDVPQPPIEELIPKSHLRKSPLPLPEVNELDVVRHFTRLSHKNYSVDTNMYPLGSCTMKYNPKINEKIASMDEWANIHPYQDEKTVQGILELIYETQEYLCEISGMDAVSMHPAAGAHGELLGLMLIKAYHENKGNKRTKIIVPDSSHGTNPSSASIAGYKVVTIKSGPDGEVDLEALKRELCDDTAAVMLTNPNTLGIFEERILQIADLVHKKDALLYCDGANLNAMLGRYRPGDMGFDIMHINLHKTFATPHGGGGPGAGPVTVKKELKPFLPVPVVEKVNDKYTLNYGYPKTIGKISTFYGNIGVILRAYVYIRSLGAKGLKDVSSYSVLNANYLREKLKKYFNLPYEKPCMHEFVLSAKAQKDKGVRAADIAKRLLDYGFYAPTVYFPLIVQEALMIEPTETESLDTLDKFMEVLERIHEEIENDPDIVKSAPHNLSVQRLDEVTAARNLDLKWEQ